MTDPPVQPVATPPDAEPSANGDQALEELRSLLLGLEQKQIVALQERLNNPALRSHETSRVVAEAIRLRREQGGEAALREALAPSVQEALQESVRKDPSSLAGVLFPVMGPAIRKSVGEAIRGMLESFNKTLESSLSIRGMKWRIEALRTGRSYAEVALLRSLVFRVEQVFVIHRKTSLLLLHAVAPDVAAQDADMVSGMLSAIQDFVRDSFQAAPGEALDSLQMGDLQIWVEQGPHATLAAVVRGEAPQSYRLRLREKLEELHRQFGSALEAFAGDTAPFEPFHPELAECLVAHYREPQGEKPRPYFLTLVIIVLGLLAVWGVWRFLEARRWQAFVDVLRQEPGIVVTSFEEHGASAQIRGLRDPLAIDPRALAKSAGLETHRGDFQWQAFYSLDDAIVLQRVRLFLRPPPTAFLAVERGTLRVVGESSADWAKQLRQSAPFIPGIIALDDHDLNNPNLLLRQKAVVDSGIILFDTGSWKLRADQQPPIQELLDPLRRLVQAAEASHRDISIELVGHTDRTGVESTNTPLSEARARAVMLAFTDAGINPRYFHPRGAGTAEPVRREETPSDRQYNRSVTFRVNLNSPSP
jgi:OOP family OmpA-OmpF porin